MKTQPPTLAITNRLSRIQPLCMGVVASVRGLDTTMTRLTFVCFFAFASTCFADNYLVTKAGIWRIVNGVPVQQTGPGDTVCVIDGDGPTTPQPPAPGDPIEDRVAAWADTLGEPAARSAFASVYQMGVDRYTTWEATLATIGQTRAVLLAGSKDGWKNVFAQIDAALAAEPHSKETLAKVAEGLRRKNALSVEEVAAIPPALQGRAGVAGIDWMKLIRCIPCIFEAFGAEFGGAFGELDPDAPTQNVSIETSVSSCCEVVDE